MTPRLNLKGPVATNRNSDPNDVYSLKTALTYTGHFQPPDQGINEYPDDQLFESTKAFQKDNGLIVDGLVMPNGETQSAINLSLEGSNQLKPEEFAPREIKSAGSFKYSTASRNRPVELGDSRSASTKPIKGGIGPQKVKDLTSGIDPAHRIRAKAAAKKIHSGVRMDEHGNFFDAKGNQIDSPNSAVGQGGSLHQARGQSVPIPAPIPPMAVPGTEENKAWVEFAKDQLKKAGVAINKFNENSPTMSIPRPAALPIEVPNPFYQPRVETNSGQVTDGPLDQPPPTKGSPALPNIPPEQPKIDQTGGDKTPLANWPNQGASIPSSKMGDGVIVTTDQSDEFDDYNNAESRKKDLEEVDSFAKKHGISRKEVGKALHKLKPEYLKGKKVKIDMNTGDLYDGDEDLGNIFDWLE